jgi:hypothetical protein
MALARAPAVGPADLIVPDAPQLARAPDQLDRAPSNKDVDKWIEGVKAFLEEFPLLEPNATVSMPTFSKAMGDFKDLDDVSEGVIMSGIKTDDVEHLSERLVDRWQQYKRAMKMPTGGRNRKRKTRKGKKRTTRRKKTSRR